MLKFTRPLSFLTLVIPFILVSQALHAQTARTNGFRANEEEIPLTKVTEIQSNAFSTAEEGLEHFFSHPAQMQSPQSRAESSWIAEVNAQLQNAIAGKGEYGKVPAGRRFVIYHVYHDSDPANFKGLQQAADAGLGEVSCIFDLNDALDENLGDARSSTDFASQPFSDNPMGKGVEELSKGKFSIVQPGKQAKNPRYRIFSQPLWNRKIVKQADIDHEKVFISGTVDENGKVIFAEMLAGTANGSTEPRVNRFFRYKDPALISAMIEHQRLTIKNYEAGNAINKTEAGSSMVRVTYPDGTFVQQRFTLGRENPNREAKDLLLAHAKNDGTYRIGRYSSFQFVTTFDPWYIAFKAAEQASPFPYYMVNDNAFAEPLGYGNAPITVGYMAISPTGQTTWPWPYDVRKNGEVHIYQSPFRPETDPEAAPTDEIMHDKTDVIEARTTVNGAEHGVYDIFTGSLNKSGHSSNAEVQFWIRLRGDSKLGADVTNSLPQVVKAKPQNAPFGDIGVFREGIAEFTGHSIYDKSLALSEIRRLFGLVKEGSAYDPIKAEILRIAGTDTTFEKKPDLTKIKARLDGIGNLLSDTDLTQDFKMTPYRLMPLLSIPDDSSEFAISGVVKFSLGLDDPAKIKRALEVLKIPYKVRPVATLLPDDGFRAGGVPQGPGFCNAMIRASVGR